jgi:hypothetical protein
VKSQAQAEGGQILSKLDECSRYLLNRTRYVALEGVSDAAGYVGVVGQGDDEPGGNRVGIDGRQLNVPERLCFRNGFTVSISHFGKVPPEAPRSPDDFCGSRSRGRDEQKGANRVYDAGDHRFERQTKEGSIVDARGVHWQVTEDALVSADATLDPLPRIAARRAFWFGWHAQFPDTMLIRK